MVKINNQMKYILLFYFFVLGISTTGQTLEGVFIVHSLGGIGDDKNLTERAKIPQLYKYNYSNNKSNFQLITEGGTLIDTLKRKHKEYNFDYETVETTIKPTKVVHYKDLKNNRYERIYIINNIETYVKDVLPELNWEILGDKKYIDGFECTKAVANRLLSGYNFKITAWFCDKIPVNDGPFDYCKLPGFIFELNLEGLFTAKFINLEINKDKILDIKSPQSKVKPMTEREFEKNNR